MQTPICDFVNSYIQSGALRLHMPGHKGSPQLGGSEPWDITEIQGADSLYEARGIIRESEVNCSQLFGCDTFYSTEGSSLCIRAMLYLCDIYAKSNKQPTVIWAARNIHKSFLSAVILLNLDVKWLYPQIEDSYLCCHITAQVLEQEFRQAERLPTAVYLTCPDYLGNTVNLRDISDVCHKYGVLLIVDNAHGAYLKFLQESQHPIDLGADLCCDSAHKTLPVLTGGAYLHISPAISGFCSAYAKTALELFGSTSPSYLVLQSLDRANHYLSQGYSERLALFCEKVHICKQQLINAGFTLIGNEPLKITIAAKEYGYLGTELAAMLEQQSIFCEFSDPDYIVFMLTPEIGETALRQLQDVLQAIPQRKQIPDIPPMPTRNEMACSPREAALSPWIRIPVLESKGRILASASIGCPPAIPIVICGEIINEQAINCFQYYGIDSCCVIDIS